jgi:hypothetical protein
MRLILTQHTGTTCPVPDDATVAYRLAGDPTIRTDRAVDLQWALLGQPGRIEAYCVVEVASA